MERETFERALHLWPEWENSISESRRALGYDPAWPAKEAVKWIEANYPEPIRRTGEDELRRLNLPPNLLQYWEDCFYCGYTRDDGSVDFGKIRRRIAFEERDKTGEKTGRWMPAGKSLPELPYQAALTWDGEEDLNSSWLRIEVWISGPLASQNLLDAALSQASQTLKHMQRFSGLRGFRAHPLSELIAKAKSNRSERKRSAVERYQRNEIEFLGLIEEEWQTAQVHESALKIAKIDSAFTRENEHRDLQKRVYDRVRKWLQEPKPKLGRKGVWRERLPLPGATTDTDSFSRS